MYEVVGDSLNPVVDAIRRTGGIEWIQVRHEETAAFAAGAEAHITGRLAACAGSCGPGNQHLINGLYDAHRSMAPVLALASTCSAAAAPPGRTPRSWSSRAGSRRPSGTPCAARSGSSKTSAGAPRGAWLRGALSRLVDLLTVVGTALAVVARLIDRGRSAALLALRRGDDGWGTLCGGGGGGGACETESGEGCRGDDGGEDSSNAHVVPFHGLPRLGHYSA